MDKITLISISLDELKSLIKEAVREELEAREQKPDEKMLSINEVCNMFHPSVTRATIHNWSRQGRLKKYHMGGRVFWRQSEVLDAVREIGRYKK